MRRHDQAIELVVGVVGEREHHPVLAALAGADLDAADDAVGAGRGRDLDAVAVAVLMIEHRGEIDRRRVAANADGVDRACRCRRGKNHEAQRKHRREATDQAQIDSPLSEPGFKRQVFKGQVFKGQVFQGESIGGREAWPDVAVINDTKAKQIKGFPVIRSCGRVSQLTQFCQYARWFPSADVHRPPSAAQTCCPSAV